MKSAHRTQAKAKRSQRLRAWPTKKVLAYFQGIGRTIEPARGNAGGKPQSVAKSD